MPAIAQISINDATPVTPVAHVFTPQTTNGARAKYTNNAAAIPLARENMSIEVKAPSGTSGAHQVRVGLGAPVAVTVDGVTKVDHVSSAEVIYNFAQNSTDQERDNLVELVKNLHTNANFRTVCKSIEPIW